MFLVYHGNIIWTHAPLKDFIYWICMFKKKKNDLEKGYTPETRQDFDSFILQKTTGIGLVLMDSCFLELISTVENMFNY